MGLISRVSSRTYRCTVAMTSSRTKNQAKVCNTEGSKCIFQNRVLACSVLLALFASLFHNYFYEFGTSPVLFQLINLFPFLKNYPLFNNLFQSKVQLNHNIHQIVQSLTQIADRPLKKYKVAVGFGSCADIFENGIPLFERLDIRPPKKEKHHDVIDDSKELTEVFSYFFEQGAAGERYVSDFELFDRLVKAVTKGSKVALGGNAPVMANRLAMEQSESDII